jgi:hypothetical protein
MTGSAYNVGVPADTLELTGRVHGWRAPDRPDRGAVMVFIKAGTLDNPEVVTPTRHIWTEMAVPWSVIPDGLECYPQDGHSGEIT